MINKIRNNLDVMFSILPRHLGLFLIIPIQFNIPIMSRAFLKLCHFFVRYSVNLKMYYSFVDTKASRFKLVSCWNLTVNFFGFYL